MAVLLLCRKEVTMEYIPIYCPKCGRKVMKVNRKSTMDISTKCKKCNKRISYFPDTGAIIITDIPKRTTSSGKRLY
jgi:hypothetical protein